MSQTSIEAVIGKAILNDEFRQLLFAGPEQALSAFDLTQAEKTKLRRVDSETLDILANILNERLGWLKLAGESNLQNDTGGKRLPALMKIQGE
jgi:hypothetical protein